MEKHFKISPSGDSGIIITLGNNISPEINKRVLNFMEKISNSNIEGIVEIIPTYVTLMVIYDPMFIDYDTLTETLRSLYSNIQNHDNSQKVIVHIPVLYGGDYGMDIENVASHCGLSTEEVIKLHTSVDYLVYMLGFAPGFPYLGGMKKDLTTPRLKEPRTNIPAGSVGIAGEQTGIYPQKGPGGWQIIGRTPLKLFTIEEGGLLNAGEYLRFYEVDQNEYTRIENAIKVGRYTVKREKVGESYD